VVSGVVSWMLYLYPVHCNVYHFADILNVSTEKSMLINTRFEHGWAYTSVSCNSFRCGAMASRTMKALERMPRYA
jgi:hypothetical protein